MQQAIFRIWRGDAGGGKFVDYTADVSEGMVVLDAIHQIQASQANDLACRWNCKAGKCGSCSAEVNGMPKLMCMARLSELPIDKPITVEPIKEFRLLKDLSPMWPGISESKSRSNPSSLAHRMPRIAPGARPRRT